MTECNDEMKDARECCKKVCNLDFARGTNIQQLLIDERYVPLVHLNDSGEKIYLDVEYVNNNPNREKLCADFSDVIATVTDTIKKNNLSFNEITNKTEYLWFIEKFEWHNDTIKDDVEWLSLDNDLRNCTSIAERNLQTQGTRSIISVGVSNRLLLSMRTYFDPFLFFCLNRQRSDWNKKSSGMKSVCFSYVRLEHQFRTLIELTTVDSQKLFILFQALIGFVIPLLIIALSYYCVVNSVHQAQLRLNANVRSQEFEAQLNRRVMIFVAVCKYTVVIHNMSLKL